MKQRSNNEHFKLAEQSIVGRHQKRTKRFRSAERVLNSIFVFLYRINFLPVFGIGKRMILIETKGRKTGKTRRKPVLYYTFYTGQLTLYSARGKKSDWFKNIFCAEDAILKIQRGFERIQVKAILIESEDEKYNHLKYWFENYMSARIIFGYKKKKHGDVYNTQEFKDIIEMIEFIQLVPIEK
ncbi:MAG: nitroreductase family deazaflavin-dependent oxidoreductase [Candidatus Hermodarchaeota archaeon]